MYPPTPNRKNQKRSMFQAEEQSDTRAVRTSTSDCFQQQADRALSGPSGKANFSKSCAETPNDGLPSLTLVSGSKITSEQANAAGGSTEALKGMNVDTDQVKQMMAINATPELFQELKDQDSDQAADLAVRDTNFQRQALHDTDDEAFVDRVRSRIGAEGT